MRATPRKARMAVFEPASLPGHGKKKAAFSKQNAAHFPMIKF
jgi:hypothetical protein